MVEKLRLYRVFVPGFLQRIELETRSLKNNWALEEADRIQTSDLHLLRERLVVDNLAMTGYLLDR